ncbi:PepSY domain-containing protein [Lactobacillus hominis]|uniref:Lipoprotein n=1 Tax=Lactobacillus hominis DSM 23910 = CRBIP 24.179 TaxID=1423758 RepID=I7JUX8_9LACO|nr:PepSY domain-containing protein [Lactobacillus hominis]KRM85619.1 hypothetical protein FC41_GL000932 [Lactobacillus hominis DSM 23910 = CRBIP 24.179]MCT3347326.1 hypothetical protein [Lactobacillus hominis]CCI81861.1 Lipoprotein [Lactobacillus hominis DSM 23910 = CRBIP 24.179]
MKTNIKKLSLGAAVLGLAFGGTSLTLINQAHASTGTETTKQANTSGTINLSQNDAINKFNEKFGSNSIKEIELKHKKNSYVYEIEGFDSEKEYKIKIDANTGKILKVKSEKLDADDKEEALDITGLINRSEATKIAQSKSSGQAVKWSLEMDDKQPVWEVKLKDGDKDTEVKIDAKTQKVLKTKTDDDKHDKKHDNKKAQSDKKDKSQDHDDKMYY